MKARFVALLSALSFVGIMISGCGAIAVNPDTLADAAVTAEDFDVAAAFALSAPLTESERLAISADVRALLTLRAQLESPARVTQLLADPEAFRTFLLEVSYRYLSGRKAFIAYLTRTQGIAPQALVKYDADARNAWVALREAADAAGPGLGPEFGERAKVVLGGLLRAFATYGRVRVSSI